MATCSRGAGGDAGKPGDQDGWVDWRCDVIIGTGLKRKHLAVDGRLWSENEDRPFELQLTKFTEKSAVLTIVGVFERDHTGWFATEHFVARPAQSGHDTHVKSSLLKHELKDLSLEVLRM